MRVTQREINEEFWFFELIGGIAPVFINERIAYLAFRDHVTLWVT